MTMAMMIQTAIGRSLAEAGLDDQIIRLFDPDREVEAVQIPVDLPPPIEPPAPRIRPNVVDVSARLVRILKDRYSSKNFADPDSRRIASYPDVQAWLASLKPGKVQPRASA